jgi:hypothetical protein
MIYFVFVKDMRPPLPMNSDYQDRKRNSLRDNHVKQLENKRSYSSDQSSRSNNPHRESPTSKRRRMNHNVIEDEYHEYEQIDSSINLLCD